MEVTEGKVRANTDSKNEKKNEKHNRNKIYQ